VKMKTELIKEKEKRDMPLYTIGVIAELIGTTTQTVRIYEKRGLIKPSRKKKNRFYSENDLRWLLCLRELVHDKKISIEGIKKLLHYAPCWEITMCTEERKNKCLSFIDRVKPCWEINRMICSNSKSRNRCEECVVFTSQTKLAKKS